jgi:CubicO group peptidase (beta-lactamase class C family)
MLNRPLEHEPNTVGRYRNCDPLSLGAIVRRTVEAQGGEYLSWPQRALFDKIGIRKQVLETDLWGNFVLTGFDYGTARNWARLGQLYLQDGVWNGERILAEGWAEFVNTPAPAWDEPEYGGQVWLNRSYQEPNLPEDAFWFGGLGLQRVIVVPSLDLVVVRLGHLRAMRGRPADVPGPAEHCLSEALGLLRAAIR